MGLKNKKGMFFTLLVISMLIIFIIVYSISEIKQDRKPIKRRVETMSSFVSSVEKDVPRQLYISGFRIIFLIEKEILETGSFTSNLNSTIEELFYNGSMKGSKKELMRGANFSGIQDFLSSKASKINSEIYLSNPSLKVTQEDPWNIKFTLIVDMIVLDKTNLSYWNKTQVFDAYVPIENFEDPLYIVGTNSVVINKINRTSYYFPNDSISNLSAHLYNSSYISSNLAPSFIQRLEGNYEPSSFGIESLVYIPTFPQELKKDKSIVDYIYFSTQDPFPIYGVTGMPAWLKLDGAHLEIYNVSEIAYIP